MSSESSSNSSFTTKEILIQLDRKVEEGFKSLRDLINAGHSDHEARIRVLERQDNRRSGAIALVMSVIAALGAAGAIVAIILQ